MIKICYSHTNLSSIVKFIQSANLAHTKFVYGSDNASDSWL